MKPYICCINQNVHQNYITYRLPIEINVIDCLTMQTITLTHLAITSSQDACYFHMLQSPKQIPVQYGRKQAVYSIRVTRGETLFTKLQQKLTRHQTNMSHALINVSQDKRIQKSNQDLIKILVQKGILQKIDRLRTSLYDPLLKINYDRLIPVACHMCNTSRLRNRQLKHIQVISVKTI